MIKSETCLLKNGVRLVMCEDKTKNKTFMQITVKYGGLNKKFKYDGVEYEIKPGTAHLLEHTLVENSIYGNLFDYLKEEYVTTNATTSPKTTSFYMDTVENAMRHLVELIKVVNITNFNDDVLNQTKKPVLEEIRRGQDRAYEEFNIASINTLLVNNTFINNLGSANDINSITSSELKFIHDVFYIPSNQTIAISGNFDIEEVKKLVTDTYNEINITNHEFEILDLHEENSISKDFVHIIKPDLDEIVRISFKVNISSFSPKDRVKLSFYGSYFLEYNFNDSSDIFKTIKKENLSPYSVGKSINMIYDDYLIISFSLYGNNVERFKTLVLDIINKKPFDEEMFNLMKKQSIIELINRNDHCSRMLSPFLSNVLEFNYYDIDRISDIEEFTKEEYMSFLNSLDFTNYSISIQTKE
jgi:predicted Zn-dependent peptidase